MLIAILYGRVDVVNGSVAATAQGDGSINITALYRHTDNLYLRKTLGNNPAYAPEDFTLRWSVKEIAVNADGVIIPGSLDIASA